MVDPEELWVRYKVLTIALKKAWICFTCASLARGCIPKTASLKALPIDLLGALFVAVPHSHG
jgi:hypothetical protein